MSEAKHTPGPWRVVIDDDGNQLSGRPGIFASDELDCGIVHWDGFIQPYWRSARGDKEIHANARLIAAAPDLLNGCNALLGLLTLIASRSDLPADIAHHLTTGHRIDEARAAIAKAEGGAS